MHWRTSLPAVLLTCAIGAAPASAQPAEHAASPTSDRAASLADAFSDIDRLFSTWATEAHVPGIAWGVVVDGVLVHRGTAGVRDVATGEAVTPATVFRIASMTKSFTALAILKLRDDGRLALDDPAERYIPELAALTYPTDDAPRITVRHLLTHSAGFPEDNPWGDRQLAIDDEAMTALLRQGLSFSNVPGVAYEYSNLGYALLGRIVSVASGVPYRTYLQREILDPLSLSSTTLEPGDVAPDRLAHGYRRQEDRWVLEPPLADGAFGAMGGMLTSLDDLGRYVAWLSSAWPARDGAETGPVRRASRREMQQVWRARPAAVTVDDAGTLRLTAAGYGYGLRVSQTCDVAHLVGHAGGLPGYGSLMLWAPEYGVGLVAMGNLTYTSWGPRFDAAFDVLRRAGALVPRPVPASPALTAAREAVTRLVNRWDDEVLEGLAADNLLLDESLERRRAAFAGLRATHGACRPEGPFDVENALRGSWTLACERGRIRLAITLAPTVPPRVQHLSAVALTGAEPTPGACPEPGRGR